MDTGNRESPGWRALFEAAILELDRSKLQQRIGEAERVIRDRLEELNRSGDGLESEALITALKALQDLRKMGP
jgi:hypothetical protein